MSRYIDADKLIEAIMRNKEFVKCNSEIINDVYAMANDHIIELVNRTTTADVEQVVHAYRKIMFSMTGSKYKACSKCFTRLSAVKQNFCPHCGAKMDEED